MPNQGLKFSIFFDLILTSYSHSKWESTDLGILSDPTNILHMLAFANGMPPAAIYNAQIRAIFHPMGIDAPRRTNMAHMIAHEMAAIADGTLTQAIYRLMGIDALLPTNKAAMIGCEMELRADSASVRAISLRMGVGALLPTNIAISHE